MAAPVIAFEKGGEVKLHTRISSHRISIAVSCTASLVHVTIAIATPPAGASLPIENAGFEAQTVAPGCFQVFIPTGWTVYDPNGIYDGGNDSVGGLHPEGGPYFPAAPEGDHVALVFIADDIAAGPMGLTQVLDDVLQPDARYTLSAQTGNIASGQGPPPCDVFGFFDLDGFPGYRVQLLAGGVVIAEDDNTLAGMIPEGEFRLSSCSTTIGVSHPQLGQPLEVRLINLNTIDTPMDPGIEVDFDDVRLICGCPLSADVDGDGDLDALDGSILVEVLLGIDVDPVHVDRADVNCSGSADAADIQPFIEGSM